MTIPLQDWVRMSWSSCRSETESYSGRYIYDKESDRWRIDKRKLLLSKNFANSAINLFYIARSLIPRRLWHRKLICYSSLSIYLSQYLSLLLFLFLFLSLSLSFSIYLHIYFSTFSTNLSLSLFMYVTQALDKADNMLNSGSYGDFDQLIGKTNLFLSSSFKDVCSLYPILFNSIRYFCILTYSTPFYIILFYSILFEHILFS